MSPTYNDKYTSCRGCRSPIPWRDRKQLLRRCHVTGEVTCPSCRKGVLSTDAFVEREARELTRRYAGVVLSLLIIIFSSFTFAGDVSLTKKGIYLFDEDRKEVFGDVSIVSLQTNRSYTYIDYGMDGSIINHKNGTREPVFVGVKREHIAVVPAKKSLIGVGSSEIVDKDFFLACNPTTGMCDSTLDGNGDGVCQMGESCCDYSKAKDKCVGRSRGDVGGVFR